MLGIFFVIIMLFAMIATAGTTLLDLAKTHGKQQNIVYAQDLTKYSGLLKTMFFEKSSNGMIDKDTLASALPSGSFHNIGAGVAPSSGNQNLIETQLFPYDQLHQVAEEIIDGYEGGLKQYIKDKGPGFVESAGQAIAAQMFYGFGTLGDSSGFKGIRQICKDAGNVAKNSGAAAASTSSIYVVKWDRRIMTGLYPAEALKKTMFKFEILNNGKPVVIADPNDSDKSMTVYQFRIKAYFGLKCLVPDHAFCIYNIKSGSTFTPTAALIRQALREVKAVAGNTYIYCNRTVKDYISALKSTIYHQAEDTEYGKSLSHFDGIPIVLDENITNTETGVGMA